MTPAMRTQNWLPSIFNDIFTDEMLGQRTRRAAVPAVNIIENEKDYRIEIAAPGMGKEDLKVSINENDELVVSFERGSRGQENGDAQEKKGTYLRREFSYSSFRQSFVLPDDVEKQEIAASMENGVLTVELPKKDMSKEVPAARQIEIR
ncbi:MAG: Hsp20/alpha crystallin family protein [Bacteroidales bacterium]|nr:Hsp20/alpha crystallin family protein [Bacteroidales bacterium]MDE7126826.1 Hsp20/alpha crystallin family protein [Bacteroidales bacterium]